MDGATSTGRSISTIKLEKHLSDVKKGRARNSSDTADLLSKKEISSAFNLSSIGPDHSLNYGLYKSMLSYDAKARFVNNIDGSIENIRKILNQSA